MFGYNFKGQLRLGDTEDILIPTQMPNLKAKEILIGYIHTVIIDLDQTRTRYGLTARVR